MNPHHRFRELQDLAYRSALRCAQREGQSRLNQFCAKLGLTPVQAEIACLLGEGDATLAEIAQITRGRPSSLARTMKALVGLQVAEEVGAGGKWGASHYRLTERGRSAVDEIGASLSSVQAQATAASREAFARHYARAMSIYDRDGLLGSPDPRELN